MPCIEELHAVPIMEARGLVRGTSKGRWRPLLERYEIRALGLDESAYCQVEAIRELAPRVELVDGDAPMQASG